MNKFTKTLAAVSMAALTLSAAPFSVSAVESTAPVSVQENEETELSTETDFITTWVVITADGDDVLLRDTDDWCDGFLYQPLYEKISGNTNKLKFGDVLEMKNAGIMESWPVQYSFGENSGIKYQGTVSEVYKDSLKDLTVTKKGTSGIMELKDSSGQVYKWHEYSYVLEEQGMNCDIDPRKIHTGDVLRCAVEHREGMNHAKEMVWEVIMPTSIVSQVKFIPSGDANGDGNTDARDCAYIASMLAKANYNKYELKDDADYNNDGRKDIRDAAALSRALSKKK